MPPVTPQDVLDAFAACAGEPDAVPSGTDLSEATFNALGYDSLAVIAAVDEIQDRFGVSIPDDGLLDLRTVGQLVDAANRRLVAAP